MALSTLMILIKAYWLLDVNGTWVTINISHPHLYLTGFNLDMFSHSDFNLNIWLNTFFILSAYSQKLSLKSSVCVDGH